MKKIITILLIAISSIGVCYAKGNNKPAKESCPEDKWAEDHRAYLRDVVLDKIFLKLEANLKEMQSRVDNDEELLDLIHRCMVLSSHGKYFIWQPASTAPYQMYMNPDQDRP